MNFLVVGAGAMGRWFARALLEDAPGSVSFAFTDTATAAAEEAAGAVDARAVPTATDERFDAVCIAVPIPAAQAAIAEYADRAEEALIDVTGTMADPIDAMDAHAPDCEHLSLHPLFAPENEPGKISLVAVNVGPVTEQVRAALDERGNDLFETTPTVHDEAMETVQARAHAAVLAYALAAKDVDERFHTPISERLQSLAEQVTSGEARVYSDIQSAFDGAEDVARTAQEIAEADPEMFEQLYADAGE